MTERIEGGGRIEGALRAPASKSFAQRAIAAALLSGGECVITNVDLSNDTRAAMDVAQKLGAKIEERGCGTYIVTGGLNPLSDIINIGESGLSTRMFTPIAALVGRPITITGEGSMMTRTIEMMIEPLRALGVDITSSGGYLPIVVRGPLRGGRTRVDGALSSQFLTGMLMSLPLAGSDSVIEVDNLTSIPYIDMTLDLLNDFGIVIKNRAYRTFSIQSGQRYTPRGYNVEGDWSGASCILVAGAVAGRVEMSNLRAQSCQADRAIIDALMRAGAGVCLSGESVVVEKRELRAFEFDATQCPDLFPALAALAANCTGTTTIKGTSRLKHKESDRAAAIASEFGKAGIEVDISTNDLMKITGGAIKGARVESHNDHRIAMMMAVAGLTCSGDMEVGDSRAVEKSYPHFWADLRQIAKY